MGSFSEMYNDPFSQGYLSNSHVIHLCIAHSFSELNLAFISVISYMYLRCNMYLGTNMFQYNVVLLHTAEVMFYFGKK